LVVVDGRDHDAPDLSIYGRVSRVIQNLDQTDFAANVPLPCLAALSKATRRPASWQGPRREVRGQLGRAEDIDTSMLTGDTVKPIDEDKKTQQIVGDMEAHVKQGKTQYLQKVGQNTGAVTISTPEEASLADVCLP
jgi:hypothetical protein